MTGRIETWVACLAAADLWTRITTEVALREAGSEAIEALCALVADDSQPFEARWRAAMLLGESGDRRAVPALLFARHDAQLDLRQSAIWALGCIRDSGAFAALDEIFADPHEEEQLRFVTATAMAHIDPVRAQAYLRAGLESDQDALRRAARAVLTNLREREQKR